MTKSVFVTLAGHTNAGKSSLLNAIIGEKIASVSPKPQTTRTRITGIKTVGETQMVFMDTPGLHKPTAAFDINQLHTVLPVDRYLPKIPRNSAGINIERKAHRAMVLGFLQGRLIVHELFLLMLE